MFFFFILGEMKNVYNILVLLILLGSVDCYRRQFLQNFSRPNSKNANRVPPPPNRPAKFRSMGELNDYLEKLREYYSVIGRPR